MHPSLSAPVSASTSPLTPTPLPAARQSPGHSPAKSEPAGECRNVYLETIRLDEGSQARARIRPGLVRDYAAAMRQQLAEGGLRFPPVVLFHEERKCYW